MATNAPANVQRDELGDLLEILVLKTSIYPPRPSDKQSEHDHYTVFARLGDLLIERTRHFAGGVSRRDHFTQHFLANVITEGASTESNEEYATALKMAVHLVLAGEYATPAFADEFDAVYELMEENDHIRQPKLRDDESRVELLARARELRNNYARFAVLGRWADKHALKNRDRWYPLICSQVTKHVEQVLNSSIRMRDVWLTYTRDFADKYQDGFMPTGSLAWGPNRDGYKYGFPSATPVLNTCSDHPQLGKTMYFFDIYRLGGDGRPAGKKRNYLVVRPGEKFRCVLTISDEGATDTQARAENVRLKVNGGPVVYGARRLLATLTASNTEQTQLRDRVLIALPHAKLDGIIRMLGPVKLYDETLREILPFPDGNAIFTKEGAPIPPSPIGTDGRRHIRRVHFDAVIDHPNFNVSAAARVATVDASEPYSDHLLVEPGDLIDVAVTYENTGTMKQKDIQLVLGQLPLAVDLYQGAVRVTRPATPETSLVAELKLGGGRTPILGDSEPGETITATFQLKVRDIADGSFAYRQGVHWLNMVDKFCIDTGNDMKCASIDLLIYAQHGTEMPPGYVSPRFQGDQQKHAPK